MADLPDKLTLAQNRDRAARREPWFRRIGLSLLIALCLLGLANLFGQRPGTTKAATAAASLSAARLQQIAKLDEIQWAVLETTGQISFIKRS